MDGALSAGPLVIRAMQLGNSGVLPGSSPHLSVSSLSSPAVVPAKLFLVSE
jgi:hypothetical protein